MANTPDDRAVDEYLEAWLRGDAAATEATLRDRPDLGQETRARIERIAATLRIDRALAEDGASVPDLPAAVGPYRIRRELGRGGQAVVYLAEDVRLRREVALKVVPRASSTCRGALGEEDATARIRREAEIAAAIDHPAICPVFDFGLERDLCYVAMRHVPGVTLARALAAERARSPGERQPPDRWVELVEQVARALHLAHEAGVIHRDVKPSNLMVKPDGTPVVVDFGLALAQNAPANSRLTGTGDAPGTPAYMAPEQFDGTGAVLTARADVYALGAVLYECATLRPPFEAPTRDALRERIRRGGAQDPRRLNGAVSRDLAAVILVALDLEPARRYQSAAALADDLQRVRDRRPVSARPAGALRRLRRFTVREPLLCGAVALLVLALGLGLAASLHFLGLARQAAALSRRGELLARSAALLERDPRAALGSALEAAAVAAGAEVHDAVLAAADALHECSEPLDLGARAPRIGFAPGARSAYSIDPGGRVRLADLAARTVSAPLLDGAANTCLPLFSGDGARLAVAFSDGSTWLYSAATDPGVRASIPGPTAPLAFAFSADGRFLIAFTRDGLQVKVDAANGMELERVPVDWDAGRPPRNAGGGLVAAGASATSTRVFDCRDGSLARFRDVPVAAAECFAAARGDLLLCVDAERRAQLWSGTTPVWAEPLRLDWGETVVAFRPDGRELALGCCSGTVVFAAADSALPAPRACRAQVRAAGCIAYREDGALLVVAGDDERVRVFDAATGGERAVLAGHEGNVGGVAFAPDGERIYSGGLDGTVRCFQLRSGRDRAGCSFVGETLLAVGLERSGERAVVGTASGVVFVLDTGTLTAHTLWSARGSEVRAASFSPHGSEILLALRGTGSLSGAVLLDAATGTVRLELPHPGGVWDAKFSRDGGAIITACEDGVARVFDAETGACRAELAGHGAGVRAAAFGRDAATAITAVESLADPCVRVFDVRSGRLRIAPIRVAAGQPVGVSASPDGALFAVATWNGAAEALVYDLRDGRLVHRLADHSDGLTGIAFSPDGRYLLTTSKDRTVRLFEARTGAPWLTLRGARESIAAGDVAGTVAVAATELGAVRVFPVDAVAHGGALAALLGLSPVNR